MTVLIFMVLLLFRFLTLSDNCKGLSSLNHVMVGGGCPVTPHRNRLTAPTSASYWRFGVPWMRGGYLSVTWKKSKPSSNFVLLLSVTVEVSYWYGVTSVCTVIVKLNLSISTKTLGFQSWLYSIIYNRLMYSLGRGFKRRLVNAALTEKYRELYP